MIGSEGEEFVDAPSEPEDEEDLRVYTHEEGAKSFVTASSLQQTADQDDAGLQNEEFTPAQASGLHVPSEQAGSGRDSSGKRPLSTVDSRNAPASTVGGASVDAGSTSSLLRQADSDKAPTSLDVDPKSPTKGILARVKRRSEMRSSKSVLRDDGDNNTSGDLTRKSSNLRNLVRFDIPDDSKRAKVHLKAKHAQMTIQRVPTKLRRQKLTDGLVVKMERMLVRVDAAGEVPDDFDENVNQRVTSRVKDKWREYMVVCRHSQMDKADFVLQLYKTRVSLVHILLAGVTDANATIGNPRNREAWRRQEGRIRNTYRTQDLQGQSVFLPRQVHRRLYTRQRRQSDLHHASTDSFQRCRVVHISSQRLGLAACFRASDQHSRHELEREDSESF